MTPDEIKLIVETAISGKIKFFWIYILAAVIIGLASSFLFEYFKTKGQNLATKSDIEILTRKVEEIKYEYLKRIQLLKGIQDIKNPKRKELYVKVEALRSLFIDYKNQQYIKELDTVYTQTRELLIFLASNDAFSDMSNEISIIEKDYNSWVTIAKEKQGKNVLIEFDSTSKALESIQRKLLE